MATPPPLCQLAPAQALVPVLAVLAPADGLAQDRSVLFVFLLAPPSCARAVYIGAASHMHSEFS